MSCTMVVESIGIEDEGRKKIEVEKKRSTLLLFPNIKCKTRENSNFLTNGKMVISIENPEFF